MSKNNKKTELLMIAASLVAAQAMTMPNALAGRGTDTGNGTDDPAIAYNPQAVEKLRKDFNLDYLKLTPQEVADREKSLKAVYDYYQNATFKKFADLLGDMGMNVYQYAKDACSFDDKASTMSCFVQYYTGIDISTSPLKNAEIPNLNIIQVKNQRDYLKVASGDEKPGCKSGDDDYDCQKWDLTSPFLLTTLSEHYDTEHYDRLYSPNANGFTQFLHEAGVPSVRKSTVRYEAVLSSLQDHVYEAPVMDGMVSAIRETQLKALDATVVFLGGEGVDTTAARGQSDFKTDVIYPPFSRVSPVPQPIIFISNSATKRDLINMLKEHAPKIYAYNKLFNARLLPEISDLDVELRQYADVSDSEKAAIAGVDAKVRREAMYQAYLKLAFKMEQIGLTAASAAALPVMSIDTVMESQQLRPIYIQEVVNQISIIQQSASVNTYNN